MNVSELRNFVFEKKHHAYRKTLPDDLAEQYSLKSYSVRERMVKRFEYLCENETPIILDGERIVFTRTVENIPDILTEDEWKKIKKTHFVHERGYLSNYSPDYESVIKNGISSLYGKDAG
ncbi:MAG: pyruvate formate-lyase, partial [Clostridia bacterium]|nr:pyruvate formate-lyase [Clostridia bacterium]